MSTSLKAASAGCSHDSIQSAASQIGDVNLASYEGALVF
jgi:hypothetical protein